MNVVSQVLYKIGQDVWAKSPYDSREHVATVVSVNASEVTVVWAHTNEKAMVDITRVRPMFDFESWVRTAVPTNTDVRRKVSLSPDRQDTIEEITKLQEALTAANRKAEMQQAEIERLRWKYQFQTDEILDMESELEDKRKLIAWHSNKMDAMNRMMVNQEAEIIELKGCLSRANTKIVVEVNAKLNEKEKLKDKCEDQTDRIAMLEYEVEEQRAEIDELVEAAKKANEKVAERDGVISELKTSSTPGQRKRKMDETCTRKIRCRECLACTRQDCGECKFCLGKCVCGGLEHLIFGSSGSDERGYDTPDISSSLFIHKSALITITQTSPSSEEPSS